MRLAANRSLERLSFLLQRQADFLTVLGKDGVVRSGIGDSPAIEFDTRAAADGQHNIPAYPAVDEDWVDD